MKTSIRTLAGAISLRCPARPPWRSEEVTSTQLLWASSLVPKSQEVSIIRTRKWTLPSKGTILKSRGCPSFWLTTPSSSKTRAYRVSKIGNRCPRCASLRLRRHSSRIQACSGRATRSRPRVSKQVPSFLVKTRCINLESSSALPSSKPRCKSSLCHNLSPSLWCA